MIGRKTKRQRKLLEKLKDVDWKRKKNTKRFWRNIKKSSRAKEIYEIMISGKRETANSGRNSRRTKDDSIKT